MPANPFRSLALVVALLGPGFAAVPGGAQEPVMRRPETFIAATWSSSRSTKVTS